MSSSFSQSGTLTGRYPAVLTSIHTGLRGTELRLLCWKQVDLLNGIITVGKSAGESKTEGGKGRRVYLSAMAVRTLQNWRSQFPAAKNEHFVFPSERYGLKGKKGTFGGMVVPFKTIPTKPTGSFATAWRTAKEAAAAIECRWHDMRHSAASRIAAGGATDQTLQALLGWMSPKMVEKYSHVREEAKWKAVSVFDVAEPETDSQQNDPQTATSEKQKCHVSILFLMVGAEGFEPPTLCSQSRCATRLRYAPTPVDCIAVESPFNAVGLCAFTAADDNAAMSPAPRPAQSAAA